MTTIIFKKYGVIISDKALGEQIYQDIKKIVLKENPVTIDLSEIKSMATFNAKQIFGRLYVELGSSDFFQKIIISNASNNIKLIIRMGIQNAIEESTVGDSSTST